MTDKIEVTQRDPVRFGGGIANAMRALRYRVTPPSDPEDCTAWEVHCPDGVTILLAKDEAEAWERADIHSRQAGIPRITNATEVMVTQADRAAVAEFHRQSFEALFATTDADIDEGINRAHDLLCQAFARHRLASTADAQPVAVQGLVEALEWFLTGDIDVSGQALIYEGHWEDIAAQISKARKALTTYQEQCDAE